MGKDLWTGASDSGDNGKAHEVAGIALVAKNDPNQEWSQKVIQEIFDNDDFPAIIEESDERRLILEELDRLSGGFCEEAQTSFAGENMIMFVSKIGNVFPETEWLPFGIEAAFMQALSVIYDIQPSNYKLGVEFSGIPDEEGTWKLELHFIPEARNIIQSE